MPIGCQGSLPGQFGVPVIRQSFEDCPLLLRFDLLYQGRGGIHLSGVNIRQIGGAAESAEPKKRPPFDGLFR